MSRPNRQMRTSPDLIPLLKHFERDQETGGPVLVAKPCVAGVPTAGWGATTYLVSNGVRQPVVSGMEFTREECEQMLLSDIERHAEIIRRTVDVQLTQGEFDALTSLGLNVQDFEARFLRSRTLANLRDMKLSVERADHDRFQREFIKEFLDWDKATVDGQLQRLRGLYRRRCAEMLHMMGLPWQNAASSENVQLDTPFFNEIVTRAHNDAQLLTPTQRPTSEPAPQPGFDPRETEAPRSRQREPRLREQSINSRMPEEVSYGVEADGRSKPLGESGRFHGAAEQREGRLYQWFSLLLGAPALLLDRFVDIIDRYADFLLIAALAVGAVGSLRWFYGWYRRKKGEEEATELLH